MEASEQRRIIEALILAAPEPISLARLAQIVPDCSAPVAKDLINELNTDYQEQDRSFEIWEVAGGFQIRTSAEFSGYLQQLRKERPLRLSHAALETLAIIGYKQPVTRAELELVRGVDTGAVLKSLLERRLTRVLGHREVPGRPLLYGTSKRFLEVFGLDSLEGLPSLRELEELAREQGVQLPGMDDSPEPQQPPIAELEGAEPSAEAVAADLASRADLHSPGGLDSPGGSPDGAVEDDPGTETEPAPEFAEDGMGVPEVEDADETVDHGFALASDGMGADDEGENR
jgi:segregation and condensation protein B